MNDSSRADKWMGEDEVCAFRGARERPFKGWVKHARVQHAIMQLAMPTPPLLSKRECRR